MNRKFYAICGLSLFLFSCQEEADSRMDSARRIYLRAAVENTIMPRAPFSSSAQPLPNPDNPLKVAVWASTNAYEFKHIEGANGSGNMVALHTTANFTGGAEQLLNDAVYPKKDGTKVYFVGMHPENGWETPEGEAAGKTATMTFNGREDVMFAPQISGQYGENMGTAENPWPTFKFHHLLTWLKVKVKADGEAVSEAWGKLKSLKIKSRNTVTIDLSKEYNKEYNKENCVSFSGDEGQLLNFHKTGTDDVFTGGEVLPFDDFREVAYVLCEPVRATDYEDNIKTSEYTLIVETEKRTVEVKVDLMNGTSYFTGSTMNHRFTLNLNFKMGNNIAVKATVTDWTKGGISNGVLNPNVGNDVPDTNS